MNINGWGGNLAQGNLILVTSEEDCQRVGNCWMKGRLRVGDVIMVIEHSGDCFYDFCLVEVYSNSIKALTGTQFGAYSLGKPLKWQPSDAERRVLFRDDIVRTEAVAQEIADHKETEARQRFDAICNAEAGSLIRLGRNMDAVKLGIEGLTGSVLVNCMHREDEDLRGILVNFGPQSSLFVKAPVLRGATVIQSAVDGAPQPRSY